MSRPSSLAIFSRHLVSNGSRLIFFKRYKNLKLKKIFSLSGWLSYKDPDAWYLTLKIADMKQLQFLWNNQHFETICFSSLVLIKWFGFVYGCIQYIPKSGPISLASFNGHRVSQCNHLNMFRNLKIGKKKIYI